jgi:hypothetical protein
MVARRMQVLAGTTLVLVAAFAVTTAPTLAAPACALSAPAYVNVGTPLTIEGAGFPASSPVNITLSIQGGGSDAFSVQSDASGALGIALTPEAVDVGTTTVVATAGATCTAQVTYTVLEAGATPPAEEPAETPAPAAEPSAPPSAPSTDALHMAGNSGTPGLNPWAFAIALVVAGYVGLALTRFGRQR